MADKGTREKRFRMQIDGVTSSFPTNQPSLTSQDSAENRQVIAAVRKLNEAGSLGSEREFSYALDRQTKKLVVRIVNPATKDVIDQIPSEVVLKAAEQLTTFLR
jgi:uncharacterized FlaG/YvyC family protein